MRTEQRAERPETDLVLPNLVRSLAEQAPDDVFLQEVGGARRTYRETHRQARAWAAGMRRRGVEEGDRVATIFPTGIDGVLAWLGCAYLGAVNVPISTAYIGHMLEHALALTEPRLILADARCVGPLADLDAPALPEVLIRHHPEADAASAQRLPAVADLGELDAAPGSWEPCLSSWTDPPSLMFTSGTTGPSKAVILRWLQLYRMATTTCKTRFAPAGDVVYCPWPLNHISATGSIYAAAISRGTAVLREKWSTSNFMRDIYDHGCTFTLLMLEMTRYVWKMELPEGRGTCPLERVYAIPTNPDLGPLMEKLGARYSTSYNSTEQSTPIASVGMEPVPVGAAGKPRDRAEVRIVGPDGCDVPVGEVGELLTRTSDPAEMFAGYWRMPDATAKAMRDGWYHTGDAVRMDADGYVYFLERMDDRIRHRGENVSPFDLETTLERDPGISKSAAVGIPSAAYGEDDIVVFVVPAATALSEADVDAIAERTLPKFMRPSRVVIVPELPETPTGKVKRAALRQSLLAERE